MAKRNNLLPTSIFGDVDKLNPDAACLEDTSISTPSEWIDTGAKALNVIISGSLYKGIPRGRIIGFSGPSQSGKSLIMNKIMANAQKQGYTAVIWDSEVAVDKQSAKSVGMDLKRTKYYPVETIEDCRNQISMFLDNVIKAQDEINQEIAEVQKQLNKAKGEDKTEFEEKIQELRESLDELKFIVSIDSLGNLASAKEIADASKDKSAVDMGTRAKALKSMMRSITYKTAKAGVPILFSNHVYDDPASLFKTLVKTQSGGKGPIYLASVLVQLSTRQEKIENPFDTEETIAIAHSVNGVTLGAMTVKNRFIPSFLKTELYLNFKTGLDENAGLCDIAEAFGVIQTASKGRYVFQGNTIGYKKDVALDKELWETTLGPALEEVLQKELCYSSTTFTEETEEIEDGTDEE